MYLVSLALLLAGFAANAEKVYFRQYSRDKATARLPGNVTDKKMDEKTDEKTGEKTGEKTLEQRVREIMAQDQRIMLNGFRRATQRFGQIIPSSARCSDGWQEGDFIYHVGEVCAGKLCFATYTREPSSHWGFIYSCHFNLADGTACRSLTSREGYILSCRDLNQKTHRYRITDLGWITQKDVRPIFEGL